MMRRVLVVFALIVALTGCSATGSQVRPQRLGALRATPVATGFYGALRLPFVPDLLADQWLGGLGVTVASPRESARRGAHVALAHRE
ncbi:MAG: hypothetical protein DLM62_11455, partial [Pseudonocardiales bacterium]